MTASSTTDHYREARLRLPQPRDPGRHAADPPPQRPPPFVPPVGKDEKRRVAKDEVHPEARYHYRPLAADLAWKAAALMPDQQERTAQVLAAGGLWLKRSRDQSGRQILPRHPAAVRTNRHRARGQQSGAIPDVPHEEP